MEEPLMSLSVCVFVFPVNGKCAKPFQFLQFINGFTPRLFFFNLIFLQSSAVIDSLSPFIAVTTSTLCSGKTLH